VELRIKRLSGWARRQGWPLNCGVLPLTINGASRFLRKWPAATVDSEPPEALWPAVKGQAGSLARVRAIPSTVRAITRKGGPAWSGRRAISGPLTGVKRVLSRSLTDNPFRRSAHIEGPDCTDSQADSPTLEPSLGRAWDIRGMQRRLSIMTTSITAGHKPAADLSQGGL
jgi:hypothetical protein